RSLPHGRQPRPRLPGARAGARRAAPPPRRSPRPRRRLDELARHTRPLPGRRAGPLPQARRRRPRRAPRPRPGFGVDSRPMPPSAIGRCAKRALDLAGATVGLALTAPLFVAIAAAVRHAHGPPVFFRQERPGLGGRTFELIKFRTMTDARGP